MIRNSDELPRDRKLHVIGFYLAVYPVSFEGRPDAKVPTSEAITGDLVDRAIALGLEVLPVGMTKPSARDVSRARKQIDEQRAAEAKAAEKAAEKAQPSTLPAPPAAPADPPPAS